MDGEIRNGLSTKIEEIIDDEFKNIFGDGENNFDIGKFMRNLELGIDGFIDDYNVQVSENELNEIMNETFQKVIKDSYHEF